MNFLEQKQNNKQFAVELNDFVIKIAQLQTTKITKPKDTKAKFQIDFSYQNMDFSFLMFCPDFGSGLFPESMKSYLVEKNLGRFEVENDWMIFGYHKVKDCYEEQLRNKLKFVESMDWEELQKELGKV